MCAATGREGRRSRRGRNGWREKISPTGDDDDDGNRRAVGGCEGAESGEEGSVAGRDVDRVCDDLVMVICGIVSASKRQERLSNASVEIGVSTVHRPSRISPQKPSPARSRETASDRRSRHRRTTLSSNHPSTSSSSSACTTLPRPRPPHCTPDPHLPSGSDPSSHPRRSLNHRSSSPIPTSSFGTRASRLVRRGRGW